MDIRKTIIETLTPIYPRDRIRRLEDLLKVEDGWNGEGARGLSNEALCIFTQFSLKYKCIAYDLGMFVEEDGSLMVTWNAPIEDIREGGRRRNSYIIDMIFSHEGCVFYPSKNDPTHVYTLDDPAFEAVIDRYRTCRVT